MPRERQKRGRRAEAKRKRDDEVGDRTAPKRQKASEGDNDFNPLHSQAKIGDDYIPLEEEPASSMDTPFYGLLDPDEQEYFSHASGLLELNQFETEEEKSIFIERVYEEADGKELKIACSQSCSRLMEKLISASTVSQIKSLFNKFVGQFLNLVQHRFASHCCESLFLRAAPYVTLEMKKNSAEKNDNECEDSSANLRLEDLFLAVLSELEGNWGYLLTERFASHTIRVLLLILAGEQLDNPSKATVIASRKKENLDKPKVTQRDKSASDRRAVPPSFNAALEKMMNDLVTGLDNTYLRALATHPVGNPVLQVLLSVELTHLGKSKARDPDSVFRRLVPDENLEEGSESAAFIKGLFYDPVGSRLLETMVQLAPGKFFKTFYKALVLERIGSLSRNEIAGHVVARILERLSKEDLKSSMDLILPEVLSLVKRSRFTVIKTLIERGVIRGVDLRPLADSLLLAFGTDPIARINNVLKLHHLNEENDDTKRSSKNSTPEQLHGSLLAQTMLKAPGPLSELIQSSLLAVTLETLIAIAKDPVASHVLQDALTLPTSTIQFRRQITSRFSGKMAELALDSSGSHVVDAVWSATENLIFIKQRFAEELLANERPLRDSFVGRAVWKNWSMDLYKRRRGHWIAVAKGLESVNPSNSENRQPPKSNLDLARARFAEKSNTSTPKKISATF
ncbi:rRNA processing protein Nop9 [Blastomyces gilchristii SLH14081]|uniref:Nucleolar protein 9 n=1 Tax=Blastomyces gilchristii (strain SLH14081) TaxID=559298 RepID=NOP9_BLAGS|nr:rRNA processing protein Nop9 [Blastomyces gilchristii SLH14081]C5JK19.1 RecName: Full=Nucleolar protein 9; AltName: Full=Pumilio domain-containing protein NOP9 [Blastomyces gilchristii SLH14081]OAT06704.1 rRNA processing protein Nop9 [Blastomyces gilchristii SLH14081]